MKKKLFLVILLPILLSGCNNGPSTTGSGPSTDISETTTDSITTDSDHSSDPSSETGEPPVTYHTLSFESNGGSSVSPIIQPDLTTVDKPDDPTKEGYVFVCWCSDISLNNEVVWPITLTEDTTFYAKWNEKVNMKEYLSSCLLLRGQDPYSFIPETMQPSYSQNNVTAAQVSYDFTSFTNISSIRYGGFGEQWNMVIENIQESEKFFNVLTIADTIINSSVVLFNNYFDNNPASTTHNINETAYSAYVSLHSNVLYYSLKYATGISIPLFGTITPQIDMSYDMNSDVKVARIQLSENNALKYIVREDSYEFAIEYGLALASRKAYFSISRNSNDELTGHIYEFVQVQGKDLIPSCADFYIDDTYVSVVGNKASGMIGFTGYINELYQTNVGKLVGYEIRETVSSITYNTLWFNLNDLIGINNIKAIENQSLSANPHSIYLNGNALPFSTRNVGGLSLKALSRRYDIELRKQYFYEYDSNEDSYIKHETSIPMIFVQEEMFDTLISDIESQNNYLSLTFNVSDALVSKITSDYSTLIDVFIANKDIVTGEIIQDWIGTARVL